MKRYLKGVFGGLLAILAAFGWCAALIQIILWKFQDSVVSIFVEKGWEVWIPPFLIFAVGFYLAFRSVYRPNSK